MTRKSLVTFALTVFMLSILGCSPDPEESTCEAGNLLLDVSDFPGDTWKETGSRDTSGAPSRIGIERAGTSFSTQTQGGAVQIIYRFATIEEAEENYTESQSDWFNLAPKESVWINPNELKDVHIEANKYKMDCSEYVIQTCRFVGLYRTDVVEFKVDIPSLTYGDLIHLLQEIDSKMTSCLH